MELHTQYVPVPALSRAALVLKAVFENGGLPAKDIARRCPCPKTTFYRLLAELVHSGYLYEDEQTKLYTPGPLFEQGFAGREEQQARLKELAGPVLEQLAQQSGQTVKLKAGYYAVTENTKGQGGYNICYYCDLCTAADADEQTKQKHRETCMITFL